MFISLCTPFSPAVTRTRTHTHTHTHTLTNKSKTYNYARHIYKPTVQREMLNRSRRSADVPERKRGTHRTRKRNFQLNINLSETVFSHRNQLFQLESSGNRGFNIYLVLFDKVEIDRKTEEKNRALNKTLFVFFFFLF